MSKNVQGQIRVTGELSEDIENEFLDIIRGVLCDAENTHYTVVKCIGDTFFRVDCADEQFKQIRDLVKEKYSQTLEMNILKF